MCRDGDEEAVIRAVVHHDFERYFLVFGRADAKDPKSAVVDAGWGNDLKFSGEDLRRVMAD